MRRQFATMLNDKTHALLKKIKEKTDVPMARLIERAIWEKYGQKGEAKKDAKKQAKRD